MNNPKTYCFDLDGTLCTTIDGDYKNSKPIKKNINILNNLFKDGNKILIFTARGSSTGIDWRDLTEYQLNLWGVNYTELILGKPEADIFIDDKAHNAENWFSEFI
tara:strand:+ start:3238 stop:3552 length:315 start_codon:yes stop_codon:yes gene_type:complete